jgi:PAS domain S-box-containing protein
MPPKIETAERIANLRRRAEKLLQSPGDGATEGVAGDFLSLIEELGRYRAEMETRSAALHRSSSELRKSHDKYRELIRSEAFGNFLMTHSPNPILVCLTDSRIKYLNPAFENLTGFQSVDLIGTRAPYPWWISEAIEQTQAAFENAMAKGVNRVEVNFQKKNGDRFWVELTAGLIKNESGQTYYLANWVDITERKKAVDELRESEERYRSLVDNITIGVSLIAPDMRILAMNRQMREWYPRIDPLDQPLCHRVYCTPPRADRCNGCPAAESFVDGEVHEARREITVHNRLRFGRIVTSPVRNKDGKIAAVIEMIEDITDRRRTEERIKNLSRRLLKAQEDERHMISRELHDSVAQDLSTVKIALAALLDPSAGAPPGTLQKGAQLTQLLDRSILSVRNLSYGLRPPGLEEFGLLQTLATFCEEFAESTGIDVDFQTAGLKQSSLGAFTEINLYRLVQEGLNNVSKHAGAGRVMVKLVGSHPNIILHIIDDGRGFDVKARERSIDDEKRLGLRSMKERVALLQGSMKIRSHIGKGTSIHIKFPQQEKKVETKKQRPHRRRPSAV